MKILIKICAFFTLAVYIIILTQQILFKYIPITDIIHHFRLTDHQYHWRSNNFVPFKTINFYLFLADINLKIRIENLVGNVIGFVPFGFICPILSNKFRRLKVMLLATFTLSLIYELLQLFFEFGSFDVDDLILNTLGGVLGFVPFLIIYFFMTFKYKRSSNKKGTFGIISKGSRRA